MFRSYKFNSTVYNSLLLALIIAIAFIGTVLEGGSYFSSFKQLLRNPSLPEAMLRSGTTGKVLRNQNMVFLEDNIKDLSDAYDSVVPVTETQAFRKKRKPTAFQYRANPNGAKTLPSSLQIPTTTELPHIVLKVPHNALLPAFRGLFSEVEDANASNQKPATISIFRAGQLVSAENAGIRLDGVKSLRERQKDSKEQSFRIVFREDFGKASLSSNTIFSNKIVRKVESLIIDQVNPLKKFVALKLARQAGLLVPEHALAEVSFNGEKLGVRLIREEVNLEQWQNRLGHSNFDFYRFGDESWEYSYRYYRQVRDWLGKFSTTVNRPLAQQFIDVEGLSRAVIFMMYCGSSDLNDWALVRDRNESVRWQWILWNFDSCFSDRRNTSISTLSEQNWMENLIHQDSRTGKWAAIHNDIRLLYFVNLLNNDPDYWNYFKDLFTHMLHNELSELETIRMLAQESLPSITDKYYETGHQPVSGDEILQFLKHRPRYILENLLKSTL
ncbi:MAG: hypothetical protein ACI8P9_002487 [Parasphingorhabdus sp.]|jgi:hypothetical protein